MKDSYIFPAVFDYADDGITVSFPDLPGCFSYGSDDNEAVKNAEKALGLQLYGMEQDGEEIPLPSSAMAIQPAKKQRIFLVKTDMFLVRQEVKPVYVKKTLTIKADVNRAALAAGINFSEVLNNSLEQMLSYQTGNR